MEYAKLAPMATPIIALNFTEAELTKIITALDTLSFRLIGPFNDETRAIYDRLVSARAALRVQATGNGQ